MRCGPFLFHVLSLLHSFAFSPSASKVVCWREEWSVWLYYHGFRAHRCFPKAQKFRLSLRNLGDLQLCELIQIMIFELPQAFHIRYIIYVCNEVFGVHILPPWS